MLTPPSQDSLTVQEPTMPGLAFAFPDQSETSLRALDMDPDPAKISMVSTRGCGSGQGGSETAA